MIEPGHKSQVCWDHGNWIFFDIGFSSSAQSCGLAFGDQDSKGLQFGEAKGRILTHIGKSASTNLLIEAPLSVCFDSTGNPQGRSIEKEGKKTRYWYVGPGCVVMVATMYLIHDIAKQCFDARVRLFEGFVSYKPKTAKSGHGADVCQLRDVVKDPTRFSNCIYSPDELRSKPGDLLRSAFLPLGLDCGIPAVIKPRQGC